MVEEGIMYYPFCEMYLSGSYQPYPRLGPLLFAWLAGRRSVGKPIFYVVYHETAKLYVEV
jgi:hypothetical protein